MSRPRAADDFPAIRARLDELRRERSRPRAADDFRAIRARMEELRRERAQARAIRRRAGQPERAAGADCRPATVGIFKSDVSGQGSDVI